MKRVLSGIKPSGDMTIGNYLGAMARWGELQDGAEAIFFVANLHAITVRQDPEELRRRTLDLVAWFLTVGIDPDKTIICVQSMLPVHSELAWILNNYTTIGELNRMTQFKDKAGKSGAEGQLVGLYDYPVLMAADILLYDADEVPVGDDQVQHIELTRDIASRFNNLYGETFKLPKPTLGETSRRIMSLDDPSVKMSKSGTVASYVALDDDRETVIAKFKRAVTDSGSTIEATDNKPAVTNLLEIYAGFSGKSIAQLEQEYVGAGYGQFKQDLGEQVADKLAELQEVFAGYRSDEGELMGIIATGNRKASESAAVKLEDVKRKIGLL